MTWAEMLARHASDEEVAVAGDWHGNILWAVQKVEQCAANGVTLILQAGDFGVWPGPMGKRFLKELSRACEEHEVDILVTLGNHEDHARLEERWENLKRQDAFGNPLPMELSPRVWILPRVWRFKLNGVSFLSFGGAASVDYDGRVEGRSWWPQEMISKEHVAQASAGGYADVMISHETPDPPYAIPAVEHILATNPMGFSLQGLSYSAVSRHRLTQVFLAVKPRLLVHGHMHLAGQKEVQLASGYKSTVIGTSHEHTAANLLRLRLADYRSKELS